MLNFKSSSYVQALYELGVENNSIDLFYEEANKWIDLINENNSLLSYLADISVEKSEKHNLINEITEDDLFRKFIYVVIDEKRSKGLKLILDKFVKRINKERGILNGTIYTTEQIDSEQIKQIENGLSKKLDAKVHLRNIIDKEIIGGIKVVVEDDVWDYTISSQIKELTLKIIKEQGE
jgi:F-type H+-transporting ATPase subunit delta